MALSPAVRTPVPATPLVSPPVTQFYRRKLPHMSISFCSTEGKVLFREALLAGDMEAYFGLASQFRTQEEPAYCGLSTLVMVLNTLEVDPQRVWKGPWRWYHENMLDCCVPLEVIERAGVTLDQFACLAACNTLRVDATRADASTTSEAFRARVKCSCTRADEVVVVSYSRAALGQSGGGHFSPVGGYHAGRDLVLILDVARFKYPPHWVPLESLYAAMQSIDKVTGLPRGYLTLSKTSALPTVLFRFSPRFSVTGSSWESGARAHLVDFDRQWTTFLSTPLASLCLNSAGVVEAAVERLVEIQDSFGGSFSLLERQLDVDCTTGDALHRCVALELTTALEGLAVSGVVRAALDRRSGASGKGLMYDGANQLEDRANRRGDQSNQLVDQSNKLDNDQQSDQMSRKVCQSDTSGFSCQLSRWHHMVALLLFWPYEDNSLRSSGQAVVSEMVESTVFKCVAGDQGNGDVTVDQGMEAEKVMEAVKLQTFKETNSLTELDMCGGTIGESKDAGKVVQTLVSSTASQKSGFFDQALEARTVSKARDAEIALEAAIVGQSQNAGTVSQALGGILAEQLQLSACQSLQNEMGQLRQQLSSVISYTCNRTWCSCSKMKNSDVGL